MAMSQMVRSFRWPWIYTVGLPRTGWRSLSEISKELKEIFKGAAELRKAQGIEFVRWDITVDKSLLVGLEEMWNEWMFYLGTDKAGVFLHHCMMRYSEVLREAVKEKYGKKK